MCFCNYYVGADLTPGPLQHSKMTAASGGSTGTTIPGTALTPCPLRYREMTAASGGSTGITVTGTALTPGPLQWARSHLGQ